MKEIQMWYRMIVIEMTLDEILKLGEFPEDATLEDIIKKIGLDKVRVVEDEEAPVDSEV